MYRGGLHASKQFITTSACKIPCIEAGRMPHNSPVRFMNAKLIFLAPIHGHDTTRATLEPLVGKPTTSCVPVIECLLYLRSFTRSSFFLFLCHIRVLEQTSCGNISGAQKVPCWDAEPLRRCGWMRCSAYTGHKNTLSNTDCVCKNVYKLAKNESQKFKEKKFGAGIFSGSSVSQP